MTGRSGVGLAALLAAVGGVGLGCPGAGPPPPQVATEEDAAAPTVDQADTRSPVSRDQQTAVPPAAVVTPVTGRVTSRAGGLPLAGAVVEVRRRTPEISAGRLRVRGETNDDGRFQLLLSAEESPNSELFIRVSGPGLPTHVQSIDDGDVVMDTRMVPLVGRVLGVGDAGVAGARIVVWSVDKLPTLAAMLASPVALPVMAEAVTAEDGGFEVASASPGWYVVEASSSVDGVVLVGRALIVHAQGTPGVDLRLRPAASLVGEVILENDQMTPAAGLTVQVAGRWVLTDADGRFLLDELPPGLLLPVEVFKPAVAKAAVSFSVALDAGERRSIRIPIAAPRPDKRRRVVISMAGQSVPEGVADATLALKLVAMDQSPLVGRELRLRRQGSRDHVTRQSVDGGLVVHPSAPQSRWDVWLQPASSLGIALLLERSVAPAAADTPVAVAVPDLCDVVGRSLGGSSLAVAGTRVSIGFMLPGRRGGTLVRSDSRGVFVAEGIPAGQLAIRLASAGRAAEQSPTVKGGQRHQHVLKVATSSPRFRGTVLALGANGRPRPDVRIEAVDAMTGSLLSAVESGEDGQFVLALGQVGAMDVEVASVVGGWRRQSRTLKTSHANPLELRVGFPSRLVVTCQDEEGRPRSLPVEVAVSLEGESTPRSFEGVTDAQGSLRLTGISPGIAAVELSVPGAVTEIFRDVEFREGEATAVHMTLVPASELQLRVLGENGRPLRGAEVAISHRDASSWQRRVGADGQVVVGALRAGSFNVEVTAVGHLPWQETVAIAKGQVVTRQVVLKEVFGVAGAVVTAESGAPVSAARCTLLIPGAPRTTTSSPEGRFSFDLVPTGTWRLRVEADGYQAAEVRVGRPAPGAPNRVGVEVKLEPQG